MEDENKKRLFAFQVDIETNASSEKYGLECATTFINSLKSQRITSVGITDGHCRTQLKSIKKLGQKQILNRITQLGKLNTCRVGRAIWETQTSCFKHRFFMLRSL